MVKEKAVNKKYKQIRVLVEDSAYELHKKRAKELRMDLQLYAGLLLSGYKITKSEETQ